MLNLFPELSTQPMNTKYNAVTRLIHWLTVLLVVLAFALGPEDVDEIDNPGIDLGVQAHETLGLLVLGLTIFRLLWVLFVQPRVEIPMSRLTMVSAKALQGLLYLLLISAPLTAVFGVWLEGDGLSLLSNIPVPSPIQSNDKLGELLLDLHPVLADILMWLAGIHAAAALFHHYFLRDDVLKSMLPK